MNEKSIQSKSELTKVEPLKFHTLLKETDKNYYLNEDAPDLDITI